MIATVGLWLPAGALAQPTLSVAPTQVTFLQSTSGSPPPSQTVSITSAGGAVPVSITGGGATWLSHSLSAATTPAILTLQVLSVGLAEGTHTTTLLVNGAGASNTPRTIAVSITVTGIPPTNVNPSQLTFFYSSGGVVPDAQTFVLANTAASYSLSSDRSWLFATIDISLGAPVGYVTVDPSNLLPGVYTGLVTVTYNTSPVSYQLVSVTLQIDSTNSLWNVSGPLNFTYKSGDPPPASQSLAVSYASMIFFSVEVNSPGNWLKVDTTSGITPAVIQVSVEPTGLAIGTYSGTITLTSFNAVAPAIIGVNLTVSGAPALTAAPLALDFRAAAGASPPPAKTFTVTSTPATNFQIRVAGGSWLSVIPETGTTPATITVSANPSGLTAGTYRASIIIQTPGATAGGQLVAVSLTVTGSVSLRVDPPDPIRFDVAAGGSAPTPRVVTVSAAAPASVALASSQPWLTVSPASGTTPLTVSIGVVPAGLAAGVYNGVITVSAPGAAQTVQLAVTLTITATGGGGSGGSSGGAPGSPSIRELSNGAGLLRDFAPGSIMFIYGRDFGPREMIVAPANRQFETSLGGVTVTMGGIRSPLISVSSTQILALVPFELAGRTQMNVQVQYQGLASEAVSVPFLETAPVFLTADGSGRGQAAAVNANGSINTPSARAPKGSIVSFYLTGGGLFEREVLTGAILEATSLRLRSSVRFFIGGLQADMQYAGQAPGNAAGILQFNVYVPLELIGGAAVPVTARIGEQFSQPGVTMAIE
ncbi:MAG: hypothetical protein R2762_28725 [Bryobacteraceae bacterium]